MPLQFQQIPLPLGGLDGKAHRLLRRPGALDEAINVELLKLGEQVVAQKRTGYQRVDPTAIVALTGSDVVFIGCATLADELVITSYNFILGLGDRGAALRGEDALVYRGPNNRSACRIFHVGTSQISQNYDEVTGA